MKEFDLVAAHAAGNTTTCVLLAHPSSRGCCTCVSYLLVHGLGCEEEKDCSPPVSPPPRPEKLGLAISTSHRLLDVRRSHADRQRTATARGQCLVCAATGFLTATHVHGCQTRARAIMCCSLREIMRPQQRSKSRGARSRGWCMCVSCLLQEPQRCKGENNYSQCQATRFLGRDDLLPCVVCQWWWRLRR